MMSKTAVQKRPITVPVWGGCDVLWRSISTFRGRTEKSHGTKGHRTKGHRQKATRQKATETKGHRTQRQDATELLRCARTTTSGFRNGTIG